jgi:diaminohydroxyphosphoribosylaminopyrimidine deaminase/5-amino-6-(5-phosphoribosylamino)uracil reductase
MRPTVIMKAAMTLDGQLAAADGTSQWISSPEARRDAHRLRSEVDAVMIGAGTLRADDPRLTVRLAPDGAGDVKQPVPVIVAGMGGLPPDAQLFRRDPVIISPTGLDLPGRVVVAPDSSGNRVDLAAGLAELHTMGIRRLLAEGGARLFRSLLESNLVDRAVLYYGPVLAGGIGAPMFSGTWETLAGGRAVRIGAVRRLGESVRLDADVAP